MFAWASEKNAESVCFQEIHSKQDVEKDREDKWGSKKISVIVIAAVLGSVFYLRKV